MILWSRRIIMKNIFCPNFLVLSLALLLEKANGAPDNTTFDFSLNNISEDQGFLQPLITIVEPANPHEYPWAVNLRLRDYKFLCTGILIELDLVLIAAHCIHNNFIWVGNGNYIVVDLFVYAGDHNLKVIEPQEQVMEAGTVIVPREYDPESNLNDIALIHLTTPFNQTEYEHPLSLPKIDRSKNNGTNAIVVGWKATQSDEPISNSLLKIHVPIVTGDACNVDVSGSQFCAGGIGLDSVKSYPGAAMICEGAQNEICGIESFRRVWENVPDVYTNTFFYLDWISQRGQIPITTEKPQDSGSNNSQFGWKNLILIAVLLVTKY